MRFQDPPGVPRGAFPLVGEAKASEMNGLEGEGNASSGRFLGGLQPDDGRTPTAFLRAGELE